MSRQIVDVKGLTQHLPLSTHQVYKAVHRAEFPIPHKKFGKKLLFDLERVWKWFDSLPGEDNQINDENF